MHNKAIIKPNTVNLLIKLELQLNKFIYGLDILENSKMDKKRFAVIVMF